MSPCLSDTCQHRSLNKSCRPPSSKCLLRSSSSPTCPRQVHRRPRRRSSTRSHSQPNTRPRRKSCSWSFRSRPGRCPNRKPCKRPHPSRHRFQSNRRCTLSTLRLPSRPRVSLPSKPCSWWHQWQPDSSPPSNSCKCSPQSPSTSQRGSSNSSTHPSLVGTALRRSWCRYLPRRSHKCPCRSCCSSRTPCCLDTCPHRN